MNLDKFLGCIYGAAIGDALGGPFETMSSDAIRNIAGNVQRKFESPSINPHLRNGDFRRNVQIGAISDDTIALCAVMRGITRAYLLGEIPFDEVMDIIAEEHKYVFLDHQDRGWGRSHRKACQALLSGTHWSKSGTVDGAGNGVMMKMAPYGLMASIMREDERVIQDECLVLAKMTHLGTPAIVGGAVHAFAIANLAWNIRDPFTLLPILYRFAIDLESVLDYWKDSISAQIKNIMEYLEYGMEGRITEEQNPECISSLFFGGTSYAPSSFGTAYAIFCKGCLDIENPDPFRLVIDAVSAGGDTDTNASIVGSLVGALHGMSVIPKKLADGVEFSKDIEREVQEFYSVCENASSITKERKIAERRGQNGHGYQV